MRRMIDAEAVVNYLRNEVHACKAAAVIERYADKNAVYAVPVEEKVTLEDGYGILIHRDPAQIKITRREIRNG